MPVNASNCSATNARVSGLRNASSSTISLPRRSRVVRKKTKKITVTSAETSTPRSFSAPVPALSAVAPYWV